MRSLYRCDGRQLKIREKQGMSLPRTREGFGPAMYPSMSPQIMLTDESSVTGILLALRTR